MKQESFDFDQRAIDEAVGRIKTAAEYVSGLRGFVPTDPLAASALQSRVAELRAALDVLSRLAESIDRARVRQGARKR
jgi:hypothetical protein